ncbi:MAG TPA: hypothetical protein PKG52_02065 [bacterium]|nr:hypothetical protein [bacterium]HPS29100.1 hypothetical protein [bacterium]
MNEKRCCSMPVRDLVVFSFAISGLALNTLLILNDIKLRGYCPYLSGIPSCYITADGFLLILLSIFLLNRPLKNLLFSAGMAMGLSISIYFSAMHLLMINPSPEFYGISTSYATVLIFLIIIMVKFLVIKKKP